MSNWSDFAPRVREGLDPLLDLLAHTSTRATFFILGYQAEQTPDLIRGIARQGHEICSHGYSHRFVYQQTQGEFRHDIQRSKQILEQLAGRVVEGYRAPFFSITNESLWAHDILLEEGFVYDSSVFPVKNYRYGIPGANREPGWLETEAGNLIYEVPLSTYRVGLTSQSFGMNLPMSGGGYFRLYPYSLTRQLVRQIHKEGLPLIFYVHPWEYDTQHPKVQMHRRFARFTHYHNLDTTMSKTARLLKDFQFGTIEQTYSKIYR